MDNCEPSSPTVVIEYYETHDRPFATWAVATTGDANTARSAVTTVIPTRNQVCGAAEWHRLDGIAISGLTRLLTRRKSYERERLGPTFNGFYVLPDSPPFEVPWSLVVDMATE